MQQNNNLTYNVKNGEIELMRFISTIIILLFHFFYCRGFSIYFCHGYIAVEFFFIVSGYLLMKTYDNKKMNKGFNIYCYIGKRYLFYIKCVSIMAFIAFILKIIINHLSIKEIIIIFLNEIPEVALVHSPIWTAPLVSYTWYLSALIISHLLCITLVKIWGKEYIFGIAPFVSITILSYLFSHYGTITFANYLGVLRAIALTNIGMILYGLSGKILLPKFSRPLAYAGGVLPFCMQSTHVKII